MWEVKSRSTPREEEGRRTPKHRISGARPAAGLGRSPEAVPQHPRPGPGLPAGRAGSAACGAPPAALRAAIRTRTHTYTYTDVRMLGSISLSSSSCTRDHRQDAALAAGDHRAPRHRAGAPLRLHCRQRKYGTEASGRTEAVRFICGSFSSPAFCRKSLFPDDCLAIGGILSMLH